MKVENLKIVTVIQWPDDATRIEVEEALTQRGYAFDSNGVLEFILDNLFEDEAEDDEVDETPGAKLGALFAEQAMNFVNNNPEAIAAAKSKIAGIFGKLKKRP